MAIMLIESTRSDADLARAAGRGDAGAFKALYERHHGPLLSFARHMLGRVHDAEDVVQHTFLAADAAIRAGDVPASLRAWLYTVARNRCVSLLRARRDDQALPDLDVPSTENLAEEVEQRDDLRALLADLRMLPDDQRAALLLTELGDLSHAEVAQVLGVRTHKVKALVYQARQALLAAAGARAIPCLSIREELSIATGSARRRRHLRDHVARCDGCRAYADGVARQRASIAVLLPVVPTVALRDAVMECCAGAAAGAGAGGATAAAGAGIGTAAAGGGVGTLVSTSAAKLLTIAAIGGAAAGGGAVAVTASDAPQREPSAPRAAQPAPPRTAPAAPVANARDRALPVAAPARERVTGGPEPRRAGRAGERRGKPAKSGRGAAVSAAAREQRGKPAEPPGLALGQAREERPPKAKPDDVPPGQAKAPATPASSVTRGTPPAKPERATPEPQGQSQAAEPAAATELPPGQANKPAEPPGQLKK
jgi:RNA polymerase sigma factor (sigma-70 family)